MALILRVLLVFFLGFLIARLFRGFFEFSKTGKGHFSHGKKEGTERQESSSDPYEILGVSKGATPDQVKRAYREALSQYHPDKVSHLGPDIQNLAREKTHKINEAYERLQL